MLLSTCNRFEIFVTLHTFAKFNIGFICMVQSQMAGKIARLIETFPAKITNAKFVFYLWFDSFMNSFHVSNKVTFCRDHFAANVAILRLLVFCPIQFLFVHHFHVSCPI